jgi:hypothetical protein
VLSVAVVVVARAKPSRGELRAARHANACRSAARRAAHASGGGRSGGGTGGVLGRSKTLHAGTPEAAAAAPGEMGGISSSPPTLHAPSTPVQIGLLAILSAAIFLLTLGSLPRTLMPHPRAAALLAQGRPAIAAGGLVALFAFLVVYFLR